MMTYNTAIENAIRALSTSASNENAETIERLQTLAASLAKRNARKSSDAAKERQAEKRAEVRMGVINEVAPIVRKALTHEPSTVKEIFQRCEGLPEGFTAAKMQYLLLHEMANEVVKTEAKNKPNTYNI